MCIRDRRGAERDEGPHAPAAELTQAHRVQRDRRRRERLHDCLLYTSDAADERSSVDLGGRRIIKKKKHTQARDVQARTMHPLTTNSEHLSTVRLHKEGYSEDST